MRNHRLLARITATLLISLILAACGGPAATVPTAVPAPTAPAPTAAPAAIPPTTVSVASAPAPTVGQPTASLGELVWKTMGNPNKLNSPFSLAVDGLGNVYVVDNGENRIQKYNSNGTFVTMWGKKGSGDSEFAFWKTFPPSGEDVMSGFIAIDKQDHIYVSDGYNGRIQKFDPNGKLLAKWNCHTSGESGCTFVGPIAVDGQGNVYVAALRQGIQKFDGEGTFLNEWTNQGTDDGQFADPAGIAIDAQGNFYISDAAQARIQKFDANRKFLTKWGTTGSGDGQFNVPLSIVLDKQGNVYVGDLSSRVQEFDSNGKFLAQWNSAGDGSQFELAIGLAFDRQGDLYVSDATNRPEGIVYKLRLPAATSASAASQGEASPVQFVRELVAPQQPIKQPQGVAVDAQGNVYIADAANHRMLKFDSAGKFVTAWGSRGTGEGQFVLVGPDSPEETNGWVAVDNQGHVYVADAWNKRVQKFDDNGKFLAKWDAPADAIVTAWISIDSHGDLYVTTEGSGIHKLDANLKPLGTWDRTTAGDGSTTPGALEAIDRQGNFYAADFGKPSIQKFNSNRKLLTTWGTEGSGDGQFAHPTGIAFDSRGNIYIADVGGARIQQFDANGKYLGQWRDPGNGAGPFTSPIGLAIDAQDQIYVTDVDGGHVYVFRLRQP